ncbi:collagenase-like protease [Candidatus Termititenax aidoneus]|uniref:Collagenase-like protease n=1 Tax=Termititenax aidoneus TaxID=2218524 RepID=A0A388TBJ2_TERA1|nr:collagenase-like protease [Candidatus Termititenax aidoneus]
MTNTLSVSIGGGLACTEADKYLQRFILAKEFHSEWFYPGIEVKSFFDSFPGLIWNGGRVMEGMAESLSIAECKKKVEFFNQRNIGVYFTFTNNLLTEEHLPNTVCNQVLKAFESPLNAVIVCSKLLENYIRSSYPQYKIIYSVTHVTYDKAILLKAAKEYDLVVIPPEWNRDLALLSCFPAEKVEIMLCEPCIPYCPNRKEHYRATDKANLGYTVDPEASPHKCKYKALFPGELMKDLSLAEMLTIFTETGIRHFKLSNRALDLPRRIEHISRYFVRKEYAEVFTIYMTDA